MENKVCFEDIFYKVHTRQREEHLIKFQDLRYESCINKHTIIQFLYKLPLTWLGQFLLIPFFILLEIVSLLIEPFGMKKILYFLLLLITVPLQLFMNSYVDLYNKTFYRKVNPDNPLWQEYEMFYVFKGKKSLDNMM